MPRATLSLERLNARLPSPLERTRLADLLTASKAQLEGGEGDELVVEATADRLDLLTEGGLALHVAGATRHASGLLHAASAGDPGLVIDMDPSVRPIRPEIRAAVVRPPTGVTLTADLLDEAIDFQELLHATMGLDRRSASLGIYPMDRVRGPVRYALEPLEGVRFTPLDGSDEVDAPAFFATHEMAQRYGRFGVAPGQCLVLRDRDGRVLSLPPILNSREAGEAHPGDGALLIESTGIRASRVADCVALLSMVFLARGWAWSEVPVQEKGRPVDHVPLTEPRSVSLSAATLGALAGAPMLAGDVLRLLGEARLGAAPAHGGWTVRVPSYRPDILAEVDVIEDILMARGFRAEEGVVPPSPTRGHRSREARFRGRISELLLGLGFVPLYSPVLVPAHLVELAERTRSVALANPVSDQFSHLRDAMFPALLRALEHNVRHGYPQRLSEVGPVVVKSAAAESGAETRYRAGAFIAQEGAGFADAAALVDRIVRACGALGVREPAELPGTIPGRAAIVRLAGEVVGEIGEVHPRILKGLHVPVPVAWAEVDMSSLLTLTGPPR